MDRTLMNTAATPAASNKRPRGVVCPLCLIKVKVIHTRTPEGHVTRRRQCQICELRVTTAERIIGGYTEADLAKACERLAQRAALN